MSLSEQKQVFKSADSFFIRCSPRCGGVQGREGEREIGGGGGVGTRGGLVLVVCVSVMNRMLRSRNKLNFKPAVLKEKHLVPPPASTAK